MAPDPVARARKAHRKARRYAANLRRRSEAVLEILAAKWPAVFPADPSLVRPWAIGIFEDLVNAHPDVTRSLLRAAIRGFAATAGYQAALAKGGPRYGLDGQPKGEVSPAHEAKAAGIVAPIPEK